MTIAFVLINTEMGTMGDVLKDLGNIKGIKEVYSVYGIYDVIAKVEAETMDKLNEVITWHIRKLDSIRTSLTLVVIDKAADLENACA